MRARSPRLTSSRELQIKKLADRSLSKNELERVVGGGDKIISIIGSISI